MHLIIVRHGQTEENRRGIVQGQKRGRLSDLGKQQVQAVAKKLKNENIDCIYSSDLGRCIDTVNPIAKYHPESPLHFTKQLREINIGGAGRVPLWFPPRLANRGLNIAMLVRVKMPGGESWFGLRKRVRLFLNDLYNKHSNETVLIVSHGITMRAMRSLLYSPEIAKKIRKDDVQNCKVWHIDMVNKLNK
jgi:broad specificity phosphatase PhoE